MYSPPTVNGYAQLSPVTTRIDFGNSRFQTSFTSVSAVTVPSAEGAETLVTMTRATMSACL